jgi:hypothetical protein
MFEEKYNKIRNKLVAVEAVLFMTPVLIVAYLTVAGVQINLDQFFACLILTILTPIVIYATVYYMNEIY